MTSRDDHARFDAVMLQHNLPVERVVGETLASVVETARMQWGHFDFRRHREKLYADAVDTWSTDRSTWWGRKAGLSIVITQWR